MGTVLCACASRAGAADPAAAFPPSKEDMALLTTLREGHPRVMITPKSVEVLRALVRSDRMAKELRRRVLRRAERMLRERPVERKLAGPRLLAVSRRCLDRVSTLALLFLIDNNRKWADRAIKEMRAAAAFRDWNPSHFLDVAEMTCALGIGYDWLYAALSEEDRAVVKKAIVEKGLVPAAECYKARRWWPRSKHNWNQVCNGGTVIGALAVADEERRIAAYCLGRALKSVPLAMASFAPDGGWAEGPMYWGYATRYNVYLLAALDTALGKDFGLSKLPGFAETGFFRIAADGPTRKFFNYADCHEWAGIPHHMWWLARKFKEPAYAAFAREEMARGSNVFDLLWYFPEGVIPPPKPLPLDRLFRGVNVALLRSAWDEKQAVFVGFKGGDNKANHSNLDLGTFVLDALGVRWAVELGSDDYNLPGYFGRERWSYYRLRTEGQNTITLAGENQDPKAKAPIVAFSSRTAPGRKGRARQLLGARDAAFAVADLSAAYRSRAKSVFRGVALLDRREVLVQDELVLKKPAEVVWAVHTRAKVEVKGGTALLSQDGKKLLARLLLPREGAAFEVRPAEGKGSPNKDVRKLVVAFQASGPTAIVVLLSPVPARPAPKKLEPLSSWIARGPLPPLGRGRKK